MFITNPEIIENPYICNKIIANYIMKNYGYSPFYSKKNTYYFNIKKEDVDIPWYLLMFTIGGEIGCQK